MRGLHFHVTLQPFYELQSEIASERPGVFDCLREGTSRLLGWSIQQSTRLLPVWKLVPPMVIHGVMHYIISSLAKYTVQVSMRHDMMEAKVGRLPNHVSVINLHLLYHSFRVRLAPTV